jgi:hypothetical protein
LEKLPFQMISGLLNDGNPLGSFAGMIDQFGPMLGMLAAGNPEMTRMSLHMAKSLIDEMIRVYDETGMLVFPDISALQAAFEQRAEQRVAQQVEQQAEEIVKFIPQLQTILDIVNAENDTQFRIDGIYVPTDTAQSYHDEKQDDAIIAATDASVKDADRSLLERTVLYEAVQADQAIPDVSLDSLTDEQLEAARALYAEASKQGFIGVYAPTPENFQILREWRGEQGHANTAPTKQRRKRRTKAQIAADNAAKFARSESATE